MSASLARFLKDFSAPPPAPEPAPDLFDLPAMDMAAFELPQEPAIDLEEERRIAFEEGRAAMRAEMEAEHAAELAALEETRKSAEAAMVKQFETEVIRRIATGLSAMTINLDRTVSAAVFNVLLPVVEEQIAARAVEALGRTIKSAFEEPDGVEFVIRGPQSLVKPLGEELARSGFRFRHIEAAGPDVSVEFEDSVFVTRLSAWRDNLEELIK